MVLERHRKTIFGLAVVLQNHLVVLQCHRKAIFGFAVVLQNHLVALQCHRKTIFGFAVVLHFLRIQGPKARSWRGPSLLEFSRNSAGIQLGFCRDSVRILERILQGLCKDSARILQGFCRNSARDSERDPAWIHQ